MANHRPSKRVFQNRLVMKKPGASAGHMFVRDFDAQFLVSVGAALVGAEVVPDGGVAGVLADAFSLVEFWVGAAVVDSVAVPAPLSSFGLALWFSFVEFWVPGVALCANAPDATATTQSGASAIKRTSRFI